MKNTLMKRKTFCTAILSIMASGLATNAWAQDNGPGPEPLRPAQTAPQVNAWTASSPANSQSLWRSTARQSAQDVLGALGSYQRVSVSPAATSSAFDVEFRKLLITELDELGMFVSDEQTAETRLVRVSSALTPRMTEPTANTKMAHRFTAEQFQGKDILRDASVVSSADVAVTVTVQGNGAYLMRRTNNINVATADIHLYRKAAPVLRVVDEK